MNVHTKPKAVTPPLAERIRIVENFRASGMKLSDYARQSDIAVATLGYWNKEYTKTWRHAKDYVTKTVNGKLKRLPDSDPTGYLIPDEKKPYEDPFWYSKDKARIPNEPDWKKLYEDEKAKVEALHKVIAVLGYQL